jgi:hypothetical protein
MPIPERRRCSRLSNASGYSGGTSGDEEDIMIKDFNVMFPKKVMVRTGCSAFSDG